MPELPEVETTRRGISPYLEGATILELIVRQSRLRWPVPDELAGLLKNQPIVAVRRRAKYLLIQVAGGTSIWHLGMSGSMRVVKSNAVVNKHDHIDLVLNNGYIVRFTDPRRFGSLLWQAGDVSTHKLLASLGPEPLSDEFDGERLYLRSRKRKVPVKSFIMDNANVVGVGNIYANEALFKAGIRPTVEAGKVSKPRYRRLADEIKYVLARAIEQGGTTLKDFVGGDGKPGYFKQALAVYGRGGQPCDVCKKPLTELRLGQRTTVYCSQCQH